jgi:hypothetical protein
VAVFDHRCTTGCNATINVSPNITGIQMKTGYTGTITQSGANTITLAASGWTIDAGTFVGNTGAITLNQGLFTMTGGSFQSTSGTLRVNKTTAVNTAPFSITGGTFTHNSGIVYLAMNNSVAALTHSVNVPTNNSLNSLTITNSTNPVTLVLSHDPMIFNGSVYINSTTLNSNVEIYGNYDTYYSGGSCTVTLKGAAATTAQCVSGACPQPTVACALVVDKTGGTITSGSVLGAKTFKLLNGTFNAPTTTFNVSATVTTNTTPFDIQGGTYNHSNGTVDLHITSNAAGLTHSINVPANNTLYGMNVRSTTNNGIISFPFNPMRFDGPFGDNIGSIINVDLDLYGDYSMYYPAGGTGIFGVALALLK